METIVELPSQIKVFFPIFAFGILFVFIMACAALTGLRCQKERTAFLSDKLLETALIVRRLCGLLQDTPSDPINKDDETWKPTKPSN